MTKALFLCYRQASSRSKRLAEELGAELFCIEEEFPYLFSTFLSVAKILKEKPKVIILQLTQGPPLFLLSLLKKLLKFNLISDMHTGFLVHTSYKGKLLNKPFIRFLKYSDLIIIHNKTIEEIINKNLKNKIFILRDPIIKKNINGIKINNKIKIFTTIQFAKDEPLEEIMKLAELWKSRASFLFTSRRRINLPNMMNLGYLKYEDYLKVMKSCDAVLALTKREYTTLSIAFEALSMGKILICSNTRALREVFEDCAIFVDGLEDLSNALKILEEPSTRSKLENNTKEVLYKILEEESEKLGRLRKIIEAVK